MREALRARLSARPFWLLLFLSALIARAQTDYQRIHSFGFGSSQGSNPSCNVLAASDGLLYGTTTNGGTAGLGTVFRVSKTSTGYTVLRSFLGGTTDGSRPAAAVIEGSDGVLYGTTEYGGSAGYGTVFKMNKDGSGYAVMYHFPSASDYPHYPVGALLEGIDGALYGTTRGGGSAGRGTAFKLRKSPATITILRRFGSSYGDGENPRGALVQGPDRMLYGVTSAGGTPITSAYGTVFKMDTNGGNYAILRSFSYSSGADGVYPNPTVALGGDGFLYGTTEIYGTNYGGVLFKLSTNGSSYAVLHHFVASANDGKTPEAGLLLGSDGKLYGTTSKGGVIDEGSIFRINRDGTAYEVIYSFSGSSTSGGMPRAPLVEDSAGVLFGTTVEGGKEGGGTLFKLNKSGTGHTVVVHFLVSGGDGAYPAAGVIQASDGLLYGTTQNGGANQVGTVFRLSANGSDHTVLQSFANTGGDGNGPAAPLVEGNDGVLYGTTLNGGSTNRGTVFKINKNGSGYSILRSFLSTGNDGAAPRGLTVASDGLLYGVTQLGGSNSSGIIFRLARSGTGYTILRHFLSTGGDGRYPYAPLIEGSDGMLYGTTFYGGNSGTNGTVFRLNRSGTGYSVLRHFQSTGGDGRNPFGPVLEGRDGMLYGTCATGGAAGTNGTVFRLNKNGTGYQVLHDFSSLAGNGRQPAGRLAEGTNGALYGTTLAGGRLDEGTAFRLEKDGSRYLMFRSFRWDLPSRYTDGINPVGGLFRGTNGVFYGVAQRGGDLGLGTLFRLTPYPPYPSLQGSSFSWTTPAGATFCFRGSAWGSAPMLYQWQKDHTNLVANTRIGAVTNEDLCITNFQTLDMGRYALMAQNAYGIATSSVATVQLWPLAAWGESQYDVTTIPPNLTNVTAIAAGYEYSLVVRGDGRVTAFGRELHGRTIVPTDVTNAIAASAGFYHSLALTTDGRVLGWGGMQAIVPPFLANGLVPAAAISAGYYHSLAVARDGTPFAWGQDYYGSTMTPPLSNVVGVAAGLNYSLALTRDGRVIRWGQDYGGAMNVPVGLSNVIAIASGESHALALKSDGTVTAWGINTSGQTTVPPGLANVVAIAAGANHSVALTAQGDVVAWGNDAQEQSSIPWGVTNVISLAAGQWHSLVLEGDGQPALTLQPWMQSRMNAGDYLQLHVRAVGSQPVVYQWQFNGTNIAGANQGTLTLNNLQFTSEGEYRCVVSNALGVVTSDTASVSVPVLPEIQFHPQDQTVMAGSQAAFSVAASAGGLSGPLEYRWKKDGQDVVEDAQVSGITSASLIVSNAQGPDMGNYSVVVSNRNGSVQSAAAFLNVWPLVAWGDNADGQATVTPSLSDVVGIAGGGAHSLALRRDGSVIGWGRNDAGQVTVLSSARGVIAVAAGGSHSLALRSGGTVVAWGNGALGQTNVPVGLSGVIAIVAGSNHNLALRAVGTVVAWGSNAHGQTNIPGGLVNVTAIAAGTRHSLALLSNSTVIAWGTGSEASVPPGLSNVVAVSAADRLSLALRKNGTVAAWGSSAGTNVPAGLSNVALIAAGTDFGLAARSDGTLISWGSPPEMGIPTGLTNVVLLAAGANHGVVLRSRASEWEVRLLDPVRTLNTFGASLSTREGSTYILEFSRNLAPDDWSAISTIRGYGYGVLRNISDLAPVDGQRFYRVREER